MPDEIKPKSYYVYTSVLLEVSKEEYERADTWTDDEFWQHILAGAVAKNLKRLGQGRLFDVGGEG